MCQLTKDTNRVKQFLAIVRPVKVKDFTAEPDSPDWTPEQQENLRQKLLWDEEHVPRLEKIPYKFYYNYICSEPGCKGHKQSIYDWELHVLYLKMRDTYKDEKTAIAKVRQKFFDQMCDPKFDLHFFVGTHNQYPSWIILGTFWPPNPYPPEQKGQLTLWSLSES